MLWVFVLLVCIVILATGCGNKSTTTAPQAQTTKTIDSTVSTSNSPKSAETTSTQVNGTLQVHYIDVGQADSILIKAADGTAVLIDGGNNPDGPDVVKYLKSQQVKELAAVIATHPHEDHIGGLDTVMKSFSVKAVYIVASHPK